MFDLNQAIAQWRREMTAAGVKTPVPLEELESHLREEIENQIRAGTTPEQAFAVAAARMGKAGCLRQEFEKIPDRERERRRNRRRVASIVAGTGFAYAVVFGTWIFFRRTSHIEITRGEFLWVLGSMAATLLLAFAGRYLGKFLPIVTNEWAQAGAIVGGIFIGVVLLQVVWAFLPLNSLIQAQVVLLWTMSPLLGFGNLCAAWCERCADERKQLRTANA